jgi:hypothetical protein
MITQTAIENRDDGIARAISHANRASADWQDRATEMLGAFMLGHKREFMAEEVRAWAELHGRRSRQIAAPGAL